MTKISGSVHARRLRAAMLWLAAAFALSSAFADTASELNRVVADVCDKQVVFLGEDSGHGSGHALAIKVDLVQRLVEECKFSAVFFESQIYDFLELDRARKGHYAKPAQLLDAMGGLWSTTQEIEPLVSYLFAKMSSGAVTLSGLDPQVGGATQLFTQIGLPEELTRYLDEPRRSECKREIDRLTHWRFDSATPFNDATRERLSGCVEDIERAIADRALGEEEATSKQMAMNLGYYLKMTPRQNRGLRDRVMYENFTWLRSRLPPPAKVIVWCATVHAVKNSLTAGGDPSLGAFVHRLLGDRSAVIGLTAWSGSVGRQGEQPRQIAPATPGSLEGRVFADSDDELRYAARRQLDELATIDARAINHRTWQSAEWGRLLDGLIVLREERPPQYVRQAEPQQSR